MGGKAVSNSGIPSVARPLANAANESDSDSDDDEMPILLRRQIYDPDDSDSDYCFFDEEDIDLDQQFDREDDAFFKEHYDSVALPPPAPVTPQRRSAQAHSSFKTPEPTPRLARSSAPEPATMLSALRRAVGILGKDRLGYAPSEIGTHSLRSGAAMCMYLHDVPVFTIMIIGRWSSDAFLRYIRKQVQEFSDGVSVRMIRGAGRDFFHIPNFALARREDPHTPNNPSNFASRQFGRDAQRHAQRPAFAVFN